MKNILNKYNMLIKGSTVIFDQSLYSLTNLITGMVLARAVLTDDYGEFILITSFATTILGIQRSMISVPYTVCKNEVNDNTYTSSSNTFEAILIIICSIIACFLFGNSSSNLLVICSLIISILLRDYIRSYLLSHLKIKISFILGFIINVVQILSLLILYYLKTSNISIYIGALAIISLIPTLIVGLIYFKRKFEASKIRIHFLMNFKFGKWILGSSVIASLNSQSYPWLLSFFVDKKSVAILGVSIALGGLLSPIIQGTYSYMLPQIMKYRNDIEKFSYSIHMATLILGAMGITWIIACIFIGDKIMILLYSSNYSDYKLELILAAIASVISGATTCINAALDSLKRTDIAFGGLVISFIVTIVLGISLSYLYGVKGALVGMIVSNIVNVAYRYKGLRNILKNRSSFYLVR
ncbi:lipopolysaccharide biosynthesis protein [Neobacillus jeddahensis]|uniref:lipopolysaccharide biosynthesis protein n=1 Tax=Neobacillus jeddahensis TaxID=1461580 RepID=UPI0005903E36|nr:polysaccharide biosynthesis C-terminal domain-containing protein [Neobacillus jeddahensis]